MAKTNTTKELEKAIISKTSNPIGVFGCLEVTIGFFGNGRVDYMTMDTKDIFRCYEIKISKSDFHSNHGHNFVGHFNYYVMPDILYKEVQAEIPSHIGIYAGYEYNGRWIVDLVKRPKKQTLSVDISVLKNSIIRSLYRDASKVYNSNNVTLLNNLKKKISAVEKEKNIYKRELQNYKNALYKDLGRGEFNKFKDKHNL